MTTIAELARQYWDAEESRDVNRILHFFTPDAEWRGIGLHLRGRAAIGGPYAESARLYPQLSVEMGRIIGDDQEAAVEWRAHFSDGSGRQIEVTGVNLIQVDDNRIASLTVYMDPTPLVEAAATAS